jgi:hypothetical protein
MRNSTVTDFVAYSMIVAGIMVLSRPGGNGPKFIQSLTGGYARIVQAATGQPATA